MKTNAANELEKTLLDLLSDCTRCKMCVSMCPTYEGWFSQSPVGRLMAILHHLKYGIGSEKELADLLFSCTTCRKCQVTCGRRSAGTKTLDIIIKARNFLVKTHQ